VIIAEMLEQGIKRGMNFLVSLVVSITIKTTYMDFLCINRISGMWGS